jgi:hypothetical protein
VHVDRHRTFEQDQSDWTVSSSHDGSGQPSAVGGGAIVGRDDEVPGTIASAWGSRWGQTFSAQAAPLGGGGVRGVARAAVRCLASSHAAVPLAIYSGLAVWFFHQSVALAAHPGAGRLGGEGDRRRGDAVQNRKAPR